MEHNKELVNDIAVIIGNICCKTSGEKGCKPKGTWLEASEAAITAHLKHLEDNGVEIRTKLQQYPTVDNLRQSAMQAADPDQFILDQVWGALRR